MWNKIDIIITTLSFLAIFISVAIFNFFPSFPVIILKVILIISSLTSIGSFIMYLKGLKDESK